MRLLRSASRAPFQNIRLFGEMSALENVMVGRPCAPRLAPSVPSSVRRPRVAREREIADRARELLDYIGLGKRAGDKSRTLAYGEQRRPRNRPRAGD